MMKKFMKGMELCQSFFHDIVKPIIGKKFATLRYSAGLLGYGSDVLGYDDETSTDHMWGPRSYLFLEESDLHLSADLIRAFAKEFPKTYQGYDVCFYHPNVNNEGVAFARFEGEELSPLIYIGTFDAYMMQYLGVYDLEAIDPIAWLALPEHKLLGLTSGKFFVDELGLERRLHGISFFPKDVKHFLIASQWALIAQEQAFVMRCAVRGDDLGSRIVCARIVERLMRLCFLYMNRYAPYSKWFGTAFAGLPIDEEIKQAMQAALRADTPITREENIVTAQTLVGKLHNKSGVTPAVDIRVQTYYERDILVIYADGLANATSLLLHGTPFEKLPLIGTMSQIGNFCSLYDRVDYQPRMKGLYM